VPKLASRTVLLAAVLASGAAGCGGEEDYANRPRPPAPINVTAAIGERKLSVSPREFGAGPIVILISNQTPEPQNVTIETEELGGSQPGLRESSGRIGPNGTASFEVNVREGTYQLSTRRGGLEPVTIEVGKPRPTAQNEVLQP
jgi:hypothetical protein